METIDKIRLVERNVACRRAGVLPPLGLLDAWYDRAVAALVRAADPVQVWLAGATADAAPILRAGRVFSPDAFECVRCGARVTLITAGRLPACPECGRLAYRRV